MEYFSSLNVTKFEGLFKVIVTFGRIGISKEIDVFKINPFSIFINLVVNVSSLYYSLLFDFFFPCKKFLVFSWSMLACLCYLNTHF